VTPAAERRAGLPRNVVALGIVSLLTDVSTEMIVPVLPLFVTGVLRASVASLGVIEGVAECTASLLRLGSGWLSDRIGERKPFLLFGYGLSTVAKASMAAAASWPAVLGLRFADRVGKGLRNPPRDALIADSVESADRGRAFGVHRALDTTGAAIGPLVAWAWLSRAHVVAGDPRAAGVFRGVFVLSAIPALLSIVVLAIFVRAPRRPPVAPRATPAGGPPLGATFTRFLVSDGVFQLGNSSMAFVLLRAQGVGFSAGQVTLVYLAYNLVYALLSLPFGTLSDRVGRRPLLLAAYALYAVGYGVLAIGSTRGAVLSALLLLGVQSALMEGQARALLADLVPSARRATAYGVYASVVGVALLPASLVAGLLWKRFGAGTTFALDAALALAAGLLFAVLLPARREIGERHA